jgi:CDP-diacylglycerol pyrophosphatase
MSLKVESVVPEVRDANIVLSLTARVVRAQNNQIHVSCTPELKMQRREILIKLAHLSS